MCHANPAILAGTAARWHRHADGGELNYRVPERPAQQARWHRHADGA
jgi:hypothetical protein